jgi:hypothetical protein
MLHAYEKLESLMKLHILGDLHLEFAEFNVPKTDLSLMCQKLMLMW